MIKPKRARNALITVFSLIGTSSSLVSVGFSMWMYTGGDNVEKYGIIFTENIHSMAGFQCIGYDTFRYGNMLFEKDVYDENGDIIDTISSTTGTFTYYFSLQPSIFDISFKTIKDGKYEFDLYGKIRNGNNAIFTYTEEDNVKTFRRFNSVSWSFTEKQLVESEIVDVETYSATATNYTTKDNDVTLCFKLHLITPINDSIYDEGFVGALTFEFNNRLIVNFGDVLTKNGFELTLNDEEFK